MTGRAPYTQRISRPGISLWLRPGLGAFAVALLLSVSVGCGAKDAMIALGQGASNLAPVTTVSADDFLTRYEAKPEPPEFYEFQGRKGDYFYLYHFKPGALGVTELATIYRARAWDFPDSFLTWYDNLRNPARLVARDDAAPRTALDLPEAPAGLLSSDELAPEPAEEEEGTPLDRPFDYDRQGGYNRPRRPLR